MAEGHVKLSELYLPSKRLRFLHLKSQDEIVLQKDVCGEYPTLFLGSDVLANCSIAVPNFPRTHAKYSKKGLTTKINFPSSVRLNGIQGTSKGVWFYNIQGLFKVAFELYSREEQLEVLKHLQPLWTLRFADPLLLETTNPSQLIEKHTHTDNQPSGTSVNDSFEENKTNCEEMSSNSEQNRRTKDLEQKYMNFRMEIKNFRKSSLKSGELNEYDSVLSCLTEILHTYKTYTANENTNLDIVDKEQMLCSVCNWAGKQFRRWKSDIETNVTDFKTTHIATIDKLPPAETVVKELFPQSMIILLTSWMDMGSTSSETDDKSWLPFPLMQLILELANQTLVSGVSHVLYSRLVNTDSV